jgi:rhomboid protease GluP
MPKYLRSNPAVSLLIAINVGIFALMSIVNPADQWDSNYLINWGADYGQLTLHGQFWRLFTSTFLHFSLLHISGNMGCLFYWGSVTERALGSRLFLLSYCLCGLLGSLASVLANPQAVSAGASGAIAGVFGIMCVMWLRGDPRVSKQDILANLSINVALSAAAGVDWIAHLGGLMGGLVLGLLLLPANANPEEAQ